MLILSRRLGESLMIGDEVTVTIAGIRGQTVRIGVEAPKSVPVCREETYRNIQHKRNAQPSEQKQKLGCEGNDPIEYVFD